jgi:hypothetical protein
MTDNYETPATLAEDWHEAETGNAPELHPVDVHVTHPVRIEENAARTIVTDQVPTGAIPVRVLGEHRTRSRAIVRAVGGDVVVGNSQGLTLGTGFVLTAGTTLEVLSTDALWAVSAAAASVSVYAEVREG